MFECISVREEGTGKFLIVELKSKDGSMTIRSDLVYAMFEVGKKYEISYLEAAG